MEAVYVVLGCILIFGILAIVAVWYGAAMGRKKTDSDRLERLLKAGMEKYTGATGKSLIEFVRRDIYLQLKWASNNNRDITELCEDYAVIVDEQERIQSEEEMLGGEFMVHPLQRDSIV